MPWQPELEGETLSLQNGSPVPFARLKVAQGEVVPIYSSVDRLEEGLKKGKVPPRTFLAGSMPAKQLLQILWSLGWMAAINKSCATGEVIIPPELMRDLASGKALAPRGMGSGKVKQIELNILDPADYPTHWAFVRRIDTGPALSLRLRTATAPPAGWSRRA